VAGGIRSVKDAETGLEKGADKGSINIVFIAIPVTNPKPAILDVTLLTGYLKSSQEVLVKSS